MTENDVKDCLRALAEAVQQDAGPSVEQRLLVRFRERRDNQRRRKYLACLAASLVAAAGLYLAVLHYRSAIQSVPREEDNQISGFISLPYAQSGVPLEQPVIVRVDIPVSELGMMGLRVAPTGMKEKVRADLLIGQDGVARAVRVVE
jgi:energy-converting hydrogenase Eha subunit F